MINSIISKNGREILRVSKHNWNNYLNLTSQNRIVDNSDSDCCLKDIKNSVWCGTCNTIIGNFGNSCVNVISSINLSLYSDIIFKDSGKGSGKDSEYYDIDIDRNENNSTI